MRDALRHKSAPRR
ncbi:hypothetical protein F2S88_29415, partial [Pseudomonas syringae pv. actinidiae]|nr:hypothetical protein [Pseudomonas syringae pv. actinidiae]